MATEISDHPAAQGRNWLSRRPHNNHEHAWPATEELPDYLAESPFPEIWLCHGYFSDDDGNNAEFSFAPLKLPEVQALRFGELAVERGVDEHGRIVW